MSGEKIDGKNINFNKDFPQFPAGENQQKVEKEMSFIPLVKETPEEEYRQKILDYSYGEEKDPLAEWQENQKKEKSKWHQYQEGWKKSFKGVGEAEGVVGKTAAVAKAVAGRTHEGFESLDHINPLYYAKMPFKSFSEYIDKVVDDGNPEKIALAETIWNTIKKGGNVLDYATSSEGIEMILACYALGAVEGVDAAANGIKTVLQSAKAKNIGLTATAAILASCDTADNYKTDIVEYGPKEGKTEITTNITINNRINVAINGAAAQSDPELKATLTAILKAIEDGNKLDKNNGDILDKILKKLESIDDRVKNLEGGVAALTANDEVKIDLLTQILTKIGNLEEGQKDMSAAAKTFYDTLLAKLDNMSAAQADFFTAVLSKLDNMSDAQANFYTALLAKMDNMSDVAIQKILDKMDVINANIEGMKAADAAFYAELLAKMDTLGDKADTIIAKFEGLVFPEGGQPVDMSKVEDLLKQILDAVKANGDKIDVSNDKLEAIFNKIDGIPGKLDAIKEKLDTLSNAPDYTALLQEIRDKIQPCQGHDCDHTAVIDALLDIKILVEQIKDKIKEDTNDPHHEGILDDLDDIFG